MYFPQIIGHRGVPSKAPENTLASFRTALALGVDGIETDVQATKDGELIICHDETLDRTTSGHGWIINHTLKEIRELSAGAWFSSKYAAEKVPTLREFLELVQNQNVLINLEIKNSIIPYPGIEKQILNLISDYQLAHRVIISSFNHYSLLTCKELAPAIPTAILYECHLFNPWEYAEKLGASAIHPYFPSLSSALVHAMQNHHLIVNPYTVDHPQDIEKMVNFGVNGIITNYPDRIQAVLKNQVQA